MILDKTYQGLHFTSIFIIMQRYDDSPPTDKTADLIPFNVNCSDTFVFGQFKRNFHELDILHYNVSFLIMSQLWQPTSKKRYFLSTRSKWHNMPALLFSYFIVLYIYSCHIIWYDPIKSALTRIEGGIVLLQIRCSTINSTNQVKMKQLCITNKHWAILIQSLIHTVFIIIAR